MPTARASPAFASLRVPLRCAKGIVRGGNALRGRGESEREFDNVNRDGH